MLITASVVLAQTNNLLISSGTHLVISDNSLVVEDAISNAGTITLENGASLVQLHTGNDNNTVAGSFNVKRTGSDNIWIYNIWASPINSANLMNIFGGQICDMWTFKASEQAWKYDFSVGAAPDLCYGASKSFVSSELVAPDGVADGVMDVGRGYYITGNATDNRTFSGTVNNGDITTTIYATNTTSTDWNGTNWNLIGNPYPSAIDKVSFWTENAGIVTDGLYFWGSTDTLYDQCTDFTVWNPLGRAASTCNSNSSNTAKASIPSGQGFWVYCSSSSGSTETVTFTNAMRSAVDNDAFYKNKEDIQRVWLSTRFDTLKSNQVLLGLVDDATMGYDPYYDAHAFEPGIGDFLTFSRFQEDYLILAEAEPDLFKPYHIPLTFHAKNTGLYKFQIDSIHEVNAGMQYYLYDQKFNSTHLLMDEPYKVVLDSGMYQNRFFLTYQDNAPNGVEEIATTAFKVYHFNHFINVDFSGKRAFKVTIFGINGSQMLREENNSFSAEISTSNWAKGVYMVQCEAENGIIENHKVVVY